MVVKKKHDESLLKQKEDSLNDSKDGKNRQQDR